LVLGRILAIDYGSKRVGIAVSDPMKIIANGLTTVHSKEIMDFLGNYLKNEIVDCFVVGYAKQMNGKDSDSMRFIKPFVNRLKKIFPSVPVEMLDERFTSKIAFQTMIDAGLKKKDRQNKALIDTISATIILQSYMELKENLAKP
jgi:putative holliday junction resolvase